LIIAYHNEPITILFSQGNDSLNGSYLNSDILDYSDSPFGIIVNQNLN